MSDKDKRSAFTTVVMSDIENNTQEVVYNSYPLPLLFYNGTDMTKNIEKIEAVPDKGITIQNDIIFYDNTYASANDTFENVLITIKDLEGTHTHNLAELIENGFTITPFISGGGDGSSDFSIANVSITANRTGGSSREKYVELNGMAYINEFGGNKVLRTGPKINSESGQSINVVLFENQAHIEAFQVPGSIGNVTITNISATGNITVDNNMYIHITGDGTIIIDYTVS